MFSNAICLGIFEDKDECKTRELLEELRKEEIKIIKQRKANEKIILQRCYDHLNRGAVDALNGYQKGSCFYCFRDISIVFGSDSLADVDHFFPHVLKPYKILLEGIKSLINKLNNFNTNFDKFLKRQDSSINILESDGLMKSYDLTFFFHSINSNGTFTISSSVISFPLNICQNFSP